MHDLLTALQHGVGAQTTGSEAASELMLALQRRGPDILDVLISCLKEEEEANRELLAKISDVYLPSLVPGSQPGTCRKTGCEECFWV